MNNNDAPRRFRIFLDDSEFRRIIRRCRRPEPSSAKVDAEHALRGYETMPREDFDRAMHVTAGSAVPDTLREMVEGEG